jgi:prepilin-type N-terminal cleavage/methylation domain-containing protein
MKKPVSSGFTLIEIIVAAMVLSISIVATVSMVRKAQELSSLDEHRRKARGIIDGVLETTTYQRENYVNLATATTTQAIMIDSSSNLAGTLVTKVGAQQTMSGAWTLPINYRTVTFTVSWNELGASMKSFSDTVRIEKWVSP